MLMGIFRTNCCLTTAIMITLMLQFVEGDTFSNSEGVSEPNINITRDRVRYLHPVQSNQTAITLVWDSPNDTISDFTYRVEVYNYDMNLLITYETFNTNKTGFTYTPKNPSPDNTYEFVVTPNSIEDGIGVASTVSGYFEGAPLSIPGEAIKLNPIIILSINLTKSVVYAAPGRDPWSYRILASNDNSQCNCSTSTLRLNKHDVITLMAGDCDGCLRQGEVYHVIVQAFNYYGVSNSTTSIIKVNAVAPEGLAITPPGPAIKPTDASSLPLITISVIMGGVNAGMFLVILALIIIIIRQRAMVQEIQNGKCEAYDVVKKQKQVKRKRPPPAYEYVKL